MDREVALLDGKARPRSFNQRILGDRDPRPLHEYAQQGDGALAQRHGFGAAIQDRCVCVQAELPEEVDRRHRLI